MSYIKVVMPNGKEYGLKFNQGALLKVQEEIDPNNRGGTTLYAVVYAGLLMNAYIKKEEFIETRETVCDWVDQLTPETGVEILNCFQEISVFQKALEENKKKAEESLTQENTDNNVIKSPDA